MRQGGLAPTASRSPARGRDGRPSGRKGIDGEGRTLEAAIVAGGALGALARLGLDRLVPARAGEWPVATFTANLVGCALLGYLATRLLERLPPSTYRRPLFGTGLCGALTTFSTVQIEVLTLGRDDHALLAAAYAGASIIGGFGCIALASNLTRRVRRGPR